MRYVGPRQIVIDDNPTPCPYWDPTRDFEGEAVAIVGSGPSLSSLDLGLLRGRRFIAVNSACTIVAPIATAKDVLYFTDNSWNENRPHLAEQWSGPVITANRNAKARLGDAVRYLDVTELTSWLRVLPDKSQASSAHIAACLAAKMGAARVVLVGMDCRSVGGKTHGVANYPSCTDFLFENRFLPGWRGLAAAFGRVGVDVVNATNGSAIPDYRMVTLEEAFECNVPTPTTIDPAKTAGSAS